MQVENDIQQNLEEWSTQTKEQNFEVIKVQIERNIELINLQMNNEIVANWTNEVDMRIKRWNNAIQGSIENHNQKVIQNPQKAKY